MDRSTNWIAISASNFYVLALKSDGTLWFRGDASGITVAEERDAFVEIGDDNDWSEIYTGKDHYFARKQDDTWWSCGNNQQDQLGISIPLVMGVPRRVPLQ